MGHLLNNYRRLLINYDGAGFEVLPHRMIFALPAGGAAALGGAYAPLKPQDRENGIVHVLLVALCKLLATAVSCGIGMPLGLIGPNLLIGACIGGTPGPGGAGGRRVVPGHRQ